MDPFYRPMVIAAVVTIVAFIAAIRGIPFLFEVFGREAEKRRRRRE